MVSQRTAQRNYTRLKSNQAIVSQLAKQDNVAWYSKPNLRLMYLLMFPTCFGVEMTSGFDASMINGLQAVPSWLEYYHHPRSAWLGLMAAMYFLGSVAAIPFVPLAVNKFGRRYPILVGGVTLTMGGIIQGSALNFAMFTIARFILGFANAFCVVAASSLIGELSHPKERAIMCSLFQNFWYFGAIAAAGVTLGTFAIPNNLAWRIPSFLQAMPSVFQAALVLFLPESPRWLISKGKGNEARAILVKYHAEGDENSDFVKAELAQIEQTLEAELKIARVSQKEMFSTPGMRKRVIVASFLGLFTQWSGVGLISHYLAIVLDNIGIHDNRTKNVINLSRYSWSFVSGVAAALIAPRYPRRTTFLACTISIFVVFAAWTVASAEYSFTHSEASAQAVLVLIFLYCPAYSLGFIALIYTYLVELFPFHVRAGGISVFLWWSRGGGVFNQFVNPIGLDVAGWRWYIVYCVWNAFQVVFVYFMFPETSGRTLEELTFLYESDREAFRHDTVEILSERGEAGTYGTMDEHVRRTGFNGEQE